MRKTKIVCTLGPATNDVEIMKQLIQNGMDAARINFRFSHIAAPPFFCRIFSFQLEFQSNRKNFDYIVNFGV